MSDDPLPADPAVAADEAISVPAQEREGAAEAAVASEAELVQPVLVPPRGLVAATLAALVATAAVAIAVAPPVQPAVRADLRLDSWRPDDRQFAEIARRQDQWAAVVDRLPAPATAAMAEVVHWLAAESDLGAQGVRSDPAARATLGRAEEGLRTLAIQQGADAVRGLAVLWGRQVTAAFAHTARAAAERGVSVRDVLDTPDGAALQRVAPGLGRLLAQTGLERLRAGPNLDPAADLVVQALAQARFLQFAVRVPDPPQLDAELQALLLRFRIEAHEGLRVERKLALLQALAAADPTYPDHLVAGVLWAREGHCDRALPAFAKAVALGQDKARAAANFAWCQGQLRGR